MRRRENKRHQVSHVVLSKRKHRNKVSAEGARRLRQYLLAEARVEIEYPCWMATLMNPSLRLRVRSAVPGRALKLSAAPPTTMVIASPGPRFRMLEQDRLETLLMPRAIRISRYTGTSKLLVRVRRCGRIPGKAVEKPVASVAKVAIAPIPIIPCG